MGRYKFTEYDSEAIYKCYMSQSMDELIEEYDAIVKCSDIVFDSDSKVYNSYLAEFLDYHIDVIRCVFTERFVAWYKKDFFGEF